MDSSAKRKTRVGILTFACDAGRSGIGQYLIHLLREFPGIAPDADLELIGHEDEIREFLSPEHNYTVRTVGRRWARPVRNILWQTLVLPGLCLARRYDVVFLPAANRRLPLWLPCPTVGTVHDFSSLHIAGKYDPLRDVYIKRVLPFLMRRLTRVISVSECTKRDIVQYARVPAGRITVIPHGVDHDTYRPGVKEESQERVCAKYGLRPPYILYISRIEHPGKNHVRLIRAFAKLKHDSFLPHQLVLAGSDWTRAREVHQAAKAEDLGEDLRFTGFVDSADLPDLYRGADLFVFPSLFEGFGMPILEAMACGVPVACANVSSLPEVAGDVAIYFDPGDEKAVTEALTEALSDPTALERLSVRGVAHAARYRWRDCAEVTLDTVTGEAR